MVFLNESFSFNNAEADEFALVEAYEAQLEYETSIALLEKEIIIDEHNLLTSNLSEAVLNEGVKETLKKWWDKAVEFFKMLWGKIKAAFAKVVAFCKNVANNIFKIGKKLPSDAEIKETTAIAIAEKEAELADKHNKEIEDLQAKNIGEKSKFEGEIVALKTKHQAELKDLKADAEKERKRSADSSMKVGELLKKVAKAQKEAEELLKAISKEEAESTRTIDALRKEAEAAEKANAETPSSTPGGSVTNKVASSSKAQRTREKYEITRAASMASINTKKRALASKRGIITKANNAISKLQSEA